MTVARQPAERYDVRVQLPGSGFHTWAVIFLSEPLGVLSIVSDYGNWGHFWGDHGSKTLKHFLSQPGIHHEYLLRKLCKDRGKTHFNLEATVKRLREWIAEERRNGASKKATWERWDAVEAAADSCQGSGDMFVHELLENYDQDNWFSYKAIDGLCVMDYDPQCAEFLRILWPVFVKELRKEIANADRQ